jgi:CheY-like chemotaxis protein
VRILVVEDDDNKRTQLVDLISDSLPEVEICIARSFQSGLRSIIDGEIDLILLDMTMTTFDVSVDEDGGRPQAYAGREILRQMERREIVTPVVVVTQFDKFGAGSEELTLEELNEQLHEEHARIYRGAVYYNTSFTGWKRELINMILEG